MGETSALGIREEQIEACLLCQPQEADRALSRVEVWADGLWRLTTSLATEVAGFSYLEPRRHIPHLTDLDGEEAMTLGPTLATVGMAMKRATDSAVIYIYVFGEGIAHLHFHLAPHREGDALNAQMIKGEVAEETLPSGAVRSVSRSFPPIPEAEAHQAAVKIRRELSTRAG